MHWYDIIQENKLQTFKLPKPVLCIGGVLLVELFVRGQKQKVDNYFHSWITWYDEWYVSQILSLPPTCTN
jgi:hypothetical protein